MEEYMIPYAVFLGLLTLTACLIIIQEIRNRIQNKKEKNR